VNYVSFPTNKNTRFPHSLGAAHTCGILFSKGLSNAQTDCLKTFFKASSSFLDNLFSIHAEAMSGANTTELSAEDVLEKCIRAHRATISGRSDFLHAPLNKTKSNDRVKHPDPFGVMEISAEFIADTLWQAIWIYALSHDLGHLPMSHAFESALSKSQSIHDFYGSSVNAKSLFAEQLAKSEAEFLGERRWRKSYVEQLTRVMKVSSQEIEDAVRSKELHESRSLALFDVFLKEYSDSTSGFEEIGAETTKEEVDLYCLLINKIALCLMLSDTTTYSANKDSEPHDYSFLYTMKRVVDGCVDGDRLDYTIRDILETGSSYTGYDLDRICRNSLLISKGNGSIFSFGFFHRAVPGIEQFFEARYQCYKYLIFHRTALRSNGCMEQLIALLFTYSYQSPDSDVAKVLARYGYISIGSDASEKNISGLLPVVIEFIERIEDNTLRSMLYEIRALYTHQSLFQVGSNSRDFGDIEREIYMALEVVLFRNFSYIFTLFKDKTVSDILKNLPGAAHAKRSERVAFVRWLKQKQANFIKTLRRRVFDKSLKKFTSPIFLNYTTIRPKCIDIDKDSFLFEDNVWIEDRFGRHSGILSNSPALRLMRHRSNSEASIKLFALADRFKMDREKRDFVENETLSYLQEKWDEFQKLKGL
jgi:HD superfamily phosphohydrolase